MVAAAHPPRKRTCGGGGGRLCRDDRHPQRLQRHRGNLQELLSLDTELPCCRQKAVLDAAWIDSLSAHPGALGGVLEQDVAVRRQGEPLVCTLLGFDVDHAEQTGLAGRLRRGDVLRADTLGTACGYVGLGVASQLRIPIRGDAPSTLTVAAPKRGRSLSSARSWSPDGGLDRMLVSGRLSVCGTFSVNADIDTRHIISPLGFAQDILQRPGQVSRVELVPGPSWSPEEPRESIDARWPEELLTRPAEKNALSIPPAGLRNGPRLPSSASSSSWPRSTSSPP